ncbi:MAG TPA: hypothetical protein DDY68_00025 [Porphyromonadaceae bacterium]|nr:hypothetical protein [Porphyromonadaceae bacterium]
MYPQSATKLGKCMELFFRGNHVAVISIGFCKKNNSKMFSNRELKEISLSKEYDYDKKLKGIDNLVTDLELLL